MKPETVRRRSPLSWVPTVYFAMGLPFILVNMVSTLMFRGLGIDDARIALRVAERHGLRTIRRTVIDDNSLEIPVRLPSDRIEAGIEIVFQIVNRNNDRYHGL